MCLPTLHHTCTAARFHGADGIVQLKSCDKDQSMLCCSGFLLHSSQGYHTAVSDCLCPCGRYFESIQGVPKIAEGYNPATWMLDISTVSSEQRMAIDLAEVFQDSQQRRSASPWHLQRESAAGPTIFGPAALGASFMANHERLFRACCVFAAGWRCSKLIKTLMACRLWACACKGIFLE